MPSVVSYPFLQNTIGRYCSSALYRKCQALTQIQKLEAIIQAQFKQGPGSNKVLSGEYELFHTNNSAEIISQSNFESFTPGTSITMAIVIGQYEGGSLTRCPRPGCPAKESASLQAGGTLWYGASFSKLNEKANSRLALYVG